MTDGQFRLECQNVTYVTPNKRLLLHALNLALDASDKACLIGRNGVGKTTLARLLTGELQPSEGNVLIRGHIGYVPQRLPEPERSRTLADLLGLAEKLDALERADQGTLTAQDAALLADSWTAVERVTQLLGKFGLAHIPLRRRLSQISGGELRRLHIARLDATDFLILDEPTNDLDNEARSALRKWLKNRTKGWLIISHDRDLLELAEGLGDTKAFPLKAVGASYD